MLVVVHYRNGKKKEFDVDEELSHVLLKPKNDTCWSETIFFSELEFLRREGGK